MADTFFIEGLNTLPEQVQINKEDIETNTEKIATNTANIATNTANIATNSSNITNLQDDIGKIVLTEKGFNKIKTMAEEVGTTIELMVTTDFTENVQSNNTNELKLDVFFAESVEPIYRNIHLVPNQTIDDYDQLQGSSESNWYTGNAMLNLPSQDTGHFAISYQIGAVLILTLIYHF